MSGTASILRLISAMSLFVAGSSGLEVTSPRSQRLPVTKQEPSLNVTSVREQWFVQY